MTTNDGDWVQDVKRWYFSSGRTDKMSTTVAPATLQRSDIGYEAAQPTLHPVNWIKPKPTEFGTLR